MPRARSAPSRSRAAAPLPPRAAAGRVAALDRTQLRVREAAAPVEALTLALPRRLDALAHRGARLARGGAGQLLVLHPRHVDEEVEAVEQRPGDAPLVARDRRLGAGARPTAVAVVAAGARVHRRDEQDPRGERHRAAHARDRDRAGLERLTQSLECRWRELRELVEEEHAAVCERDLAGPDRAPAAH